MSIKRGRYVLFDRHPNRVRRGDPQRRHVRCTPWERAERRRLLDR